MDDDSRSTTRGEMTCRSLVVVTLALLARLARGRTGACDADDARLEFDDAASLSVLATAVFDGRPVRRGDHTAAAAAADDDDDVVDFSVGQVRLAPSPVGERTYCDGHVCLSLCVYFSICLREYFKNHISKHHQMCVPIARGRGSVLLWRRCDMLCTSCFMDDVIFAHNERYRCRCGCS